MIFSTIFQKQYMPTNESFDIDGLMVFKGDYTAKDQDGNVVPSVITPDRYKPKSREPLSSAQTGIYTNTTAYWEAHATIVPKKGEIYIYEDATVMGADGKPVTTPRIKIGTGNEYLGQLPFVGQQTVERIEAHIADNDRHINSGERAKWNSKLNIDPDPSVHYDNETLYFNRN